MRALPSHHPYLVIDGKEGEGAERIPGKPMVSVVRNGSLYIVPGTPGQSFITTAGRVVTAGQRGAMWDVFIDGVPSGCSDSYCPGYRVSARGTGAPDTGTSHIGFRTAMTVDQWHARAQSTGRQ